MLEGGGKPHYLGRGSQEHCLGEDVDKGHGKIYLMELGGGHRVEKLRSVGAGLPETSFSGWSSVPLLSMLLRPEFLSLPFLSPSQPRLLAWLTFNVLTPSRMSHGTWWSLCARIHISVQRLGVVSHL